MKNDHIGRISDRPIFGPISVVCSFALRYQINAGFKKKINSICHTSQLKLVLPELYKSTFTNFRNIWFWLSQKKIGFNCIQYIGIGRYGDCNFGIGIGIGRYENQKYRWLSVSAEMKNFMHFLTLFYVSVLTSVSADYAIVISVSASVSADMKIRYIGGYR